MLDCVGVTTPNMQNFMLDVLENVHRNVQSTNLEVVASKIVEILVAVDVAVIRDANVIDWDYERIVRSDEKTITFNSKDYDVFEKMALNLVVDSLEKPVFMLALLQIVIKGRKWRIKNRKNRRRTGAIHAQPRLSGLNTG